MIQAHGNEGRSGTSADAIAPMITRTYAMDDQCRVYHKD